MDTLDTEYHWLCPIAHLAEENLSEHMEVSSFRCITTDYTFVFESRCDFI